MIRLGACKKLYLGSIDLISKDSFQKRGANIFRSLNMYQGWKIILLIFIANLSINHGLQCFLCDQCKDNEGKGKLIECQTADDPNWRPTNCLENFVSKLLSSSSSHVEKSFILVEYLKIGIFNAA